MLIDKPGSLLYLQNIRIFAGAGLLRGVKVYNGLATENAVDPGTLGCNRRRYVWLLAPAGETIRPGVICNFGNTWRITSRPFSSPVLTLYPPMMSL